MQENEAALRVLSVVSGQYIMGMNGPVDVDIKAVIAILDLYDVPNRRDTFERVVAGAREIIRMNTEKAK